MFKKISVLLVAGLLTACDHPLELVGNGDIISASGTRNCTLEDYQAYASSCDENKTFVDEVVYEETYYAIPRPGWVFDRWENYCEDVVINECSFYVAPEGVPSPPNDYAVDPLRAVFVPATLDFLARGKAPIDLEGIDADFYGGVNYGELERNVFDIFIPDSDEKTPLVIYIHGGSFTGGDKSNAYQDFNIENIRSYLDAGVAFATINYSLIQYANETEGVIKCLSDSQRALQFMRLHAKSFNIDPEKIASYGISAGASTSLWLGTKDDAAELRNVDPVARQSTRLSAMGAIETQATLDLVRWEDTYEPFGITLELIAAASELLRQQMVDFYGVDEIDDFYTPETTAYRDSVDMLDFMTSDDAPLWVNNSLFSAGFPASQGALLHHPFFARELRDQADVVGLENVAYIPELGIEDPSGETIAEFFLRHLGE